MKNEKHEGKFLHFIAELKKREIEEIETSETFAELAMMFNLNSKALQALPHEQANILSSANDPHIEGRWLYVRHAWRIT